MWTRFTTLVFISGIVAIAVGGEGDGNTRGTIERNLLATDPAEVKLETPIAEIVFKDLPLNQALALWQMRVGVNMVVEWLELGAGGIDRDMKVSLDMRNVTAATALEGILFQLDMPTEKLRFCPKGNVVWIGPSQSIEDRSTSVEVYDVRDLLPEGQDDAQAKDQLESLLAIIGECIDGNAPHDRPGLVHEFRGLIVIQDTRARHHAVAALLTRLCAALHK